MNQRTYMFVDDGSPEASDYDTNFVCYDAGSADGHEQAVLEANRRRGTTAVIPSHAGRVFRHGSESRSRGAMSGTAANGAKRNGLLVYLDRCMNALSQMIRRVQRSFRNRRRVSKWGAVPPTDRFLQSSHAVLAFP